MRSCLQTKFFGIRKSVVLVKLILFYFLFCCNCSGDIYSSLVAYMAANKPRTASFSRNFASAPTAVSQIPGLKHGPNGTMFLSSGIPDLDSNV